MPETDFLIIHGKYWHEETQELVADGVYAMPVVVAGQYVGALDRFWAHPGVLGAEQLAGALVAAELAQMPLLDLLAEDLQAAVADPDSDSWAELNTLSRAEVSQATGMLVAH